MISVWSWNGMGRRQAAANLQLANNAANYARLRLLGN